jgi:hypothetical protein
MAGLKALEATHKPRDEYSKSCIALGNSVRKLADQIKSMRSADPNGPPQQKLVVDARDNCCSYLSRVIDVGRNMFEFELLVANQNGGKEQKIIDDVVTQLGKIARWLRAELRTPTKMDFVETPLQDDVGKALDVWVKARGITLVLDASQVEGILFAAETIDITQAFISEYNSKNPVTASATAPK